MIGHLDFEVCSTKPTLEADQPGMDAGVVTPGLGSEAILTSTFAQVKASAANATSYLNPSSKDLLMLVPRMVSRAGTFAFVTIPEVFDNLMGGGAGGRIIAEATGEGAQAMAAASAGIAPETLVMARGATAAQAVGGYAASFNQAFSFQNLRTFGGVSKDLLRLERR